MSQPGWSWPEATRKGDSVNNFMNQGLNHIVGSLPRRREQARRDGRVYVPAEPAGQIEQLLRSVTPETMTRDDVEHLADVLAGGLAGLKQELLRRDGTVIKTWKPGRNQPAVKHFSAGAILRLHVLRCGMAGSSRSPRQPGRHPPLRVAALRPGRGGVATTGGVGRRGLGGACGRQVEYALPWLDDAG